MVNITYSYYCSIVIWRDIVQDVAVSSAPRTTGKSHYGLSRVLDVLFDIILLWFPGRIHIN